MLYMKHVLLRRYLRNKHREHILKNCEVVIDGKCLFNDVLYKSSGCQYLYGCESNAYADYVRKRLSVFQQSNVTCYVIFNGAMQADTEMRQNKHDRTLRHRAEINTNNIEEGFYDPIFVYDVNIEVLEELGIKYFINEYCPMEALFSVAKKLNCPVITNKIDYCLYGVSCIPVNSLNFATDEKVIKCKIYDKDDCENHIIIHDDLKPLFIMLTDEGSRQFQLLPNLFTFTEFNLIPKLLSWFKSKNRCNITESIALLMSNEEEKRTFTNTLDEISHLINQPKHELAINYFVQAANYWDVTKSDPIWFAKAVSCRRIPIPYVNLKYINQFSGCWLIYDENKNDAMLAALDIISYIHCILSNSDNSRITFIGRQATQTCIWDIENTWSNAPGSVMFETAADRNKLYGRKMFRSNDVFNLFIKETMPGFNHEILFTLHEDCWLLVVTLVYYANRNRNFVRGAYSILLSYIILNRVARGVQVLRDNSEDSIKPKYLPAHKDCQLVAESTREMFKLKDLNELDRSLLHDFAEFQHCLQHMNYLNKICGGKIRCTKFNTTYNGTFIYNTYQIIRDENDPVESLKSYIGPSYVFMWYKKMVFVYDKILSLVMAETDKLKASK